LPDSRQKGAKMLWISRISFLIAATVFFSSCRTPEKISANPDLVEPYTSMAQRREKLDAPYVAIFKKGHKELRFIAARHESGAASPTLKTISETFDQFHPQLVILEGFQSSEELSPKWYQNVAQSRCQNLNAPTCDEAAFAAIKAIEQDAAFTGGEPKEAEIWKYITSLGYSTEDLLSFYVVRQIPEWRREGSLEKETKIEAKIDNFIDYYEKIFGAQTGFDYGMFLKWYKSHLRKPFNLNKITTEDTSPRTDGELSTLNRISHDVGTVRERHLISLIADSLNLHDRVLVVYGGGHLIESRAALATMLGPSQDVKLH
jgi:hypothetical protein